MISKNLGIPTKADLAMDDFRRNFKNPITRCYVMPDGKLMVYTLGKGRDFSGYSKDVLKDATNVISQNRLPLTASLRESKMSNGVVMEVFMDVQYRY